MTVNARTRAEQLLRLVIDHATSDAEKRTAAVQFAKLVSKEGLLGHSTPRPVDSASRPPRTVYDPRRLQSATKIVMALLEKELEPINKTEEFKFIWSFCESTLELVKLEANHSKGDYTKKTRGHVRSIAAGLAVKLVGNNKSLPVEIMRVLKTQQVGAVNALAKQLHRRAADVRKTMAELVTAGQVEQMGPPNRRKYRLTPSEPDVNSRPTGTRTNR